MASFKNFSNRAFGEPALIFRLLFYRIRHKGNDRRGHEQRQRKYPGAGCPTLRVFCEGWDAIRSDSTELILFQNRLGFFVNVDAAEKLCQVRNALEWHLSRSYSVLATMFEDVAAVLRPSGLCANGEKAFA